MQRLVAVLMCLLWGACRAAAGDGDWPHWRGPNDDGMARGDAPLHWSDKEHIAWKANVPGRGHSSPVIWGDRIFLTTAVPVAGSAGALTEHKFTVLAYDRKTGKLLWEKVARVATPHQPYHPQYGSFASNSPITDGKYVIRLLRLARPLLLHPRRRAGLEEGLRAAANVHEFRRGSVDRARRRQARWSCSITKASRS